MELPAPGTYLVFLLLLAFSAFFSASETALSSANRIRLRTRAEKGERGARTALHLSDDFDRTLSAILIGNNVVNIASASLATIMATAWLGANGAAVATAVVTVLVLIFGEILPKSYAKDNAERVSVRIAAPLQWIKALLTPLVWIFVQIKRLFTGRHSNELNVQPSVTEEELKSIIDTVEEEGVLDHRETDIIQSAIDFDNITVQDILVPRVDMAAVEVHTSGPEIVALCVHEGYSRIPVYDGTIDNVIGVLYAKDMLSCLAKGREIQPRRMKRDVMFVYRTKRINDLLAELRHTKQHMAIVTDEHGGTLGLVTMEDILEELVGEIWDETDKAETPIRRIDAARWLVEGDVRIDDLFDAIRFSDPQFTCEAASVAGWVLERLEHIPEVDESFTHKNLLVTVHAMDGQRIESVTIARLPDSGA
ncbi:MAG: hemolysin family protein [Ruthenibacterium sp.]